MSDQTWNDREVCAVIDSLAAMRDRLNEKGYATPTVESALAKLTAQVTPRTTGITLIPSES